MGEKSHRSAERLAREAAALRENLKKRKAQAREQARSATERPATEQPVMEQPGTEESPPRGRPSPDRDASPKPT